MLVANLMADDRTGQASIGEIYRSFAVLTYAETILEPLLSVPHYAAGVCVCVCDTKLGAMEMSDSTCSLDAHFLTGPTRRYAIGGLGAADL
jgi:hypothetical protein